MRASLDIIDFNKYYNSCKAFSSFWFFLFHFIALIIKYEGLSFKMPEIIDFFRSLVQHDFQSIKLYWEWIYFVHFKLFLYYLMEIFFLIDFPPCHGGQFRCRNALCIPATFHCDGYQDCGSGSYLFFVVVIINTSSMSTKNMYPFLHIHRWFRRRKLYSHCVSR